MKKILLTSLVAVCSLVVSAQTGYVIKGQIGKLGKPAKAYLLINKEGKQILDSTNLVNGFFTFKGSVTSPLEATLRLKHDLAVDTPGKRVKIDGISIILGNENIIITGKDSLKTAVIKGSSLTDESRKVDDYLRPFYAKYEGLNKEFAAQPESKKQDSQYIQDLEKRAKQIEKEIFDAKMAYIKENPTKYMAMMALNSTLGPGFDAIEMEKVFQNLSPDLKESYFGKQVADRIATFKKTQEGVDATDFSQPDVDGKMVKLSDYRGKYVLIDFWASWCAPCRRENPNLVKAYEQYKAKGFEILGVSMDKATDKVKWLKAIQDDKLSWKQVGDLKGWDNEAGVLYEVKAIPSNFLIDPSGKIIAKDLRGQALDDKLTAIFKEPSK
ncbi:AhpC/TSA family protein [Pedobacter sp. ISL-68]|uniref:TlpA disulfide reductase family protein n=1 Tax=unclassified Pedobacter TaxID=2628915 RepID=UPI001BE52854|nr:MULTISPECIES: TlpA disulfide reductase family protein [unclassified Pedobacter]MBT2560207.1 AhpC/TSA family protein [Pedobacter sp. ISL-64]MBT2589186.1 AhpC/TSA family protein [Pedobacter sp. ISL-68]